jgi:hypothetical protein
VRLIVVVRFQLKHSLVLGSVFQHGMVQMADIQVAALAKCACIRKTDNIEILLSRIDDSLLRRVGRGNSAAARHDTIRFALQGGTRLGILLRWAGAYTNSAPQRGGIWARKVDIRIASVAILTAGHVVWIVGLKKLVRITRFVGKVSDVESECCKCQIEDEPEHVRARSLCFIQALLEAFRSVFALGSKGISLSLIL